MRSTGCKYHFRIRELRKNEDSLRKQAFAESVLANKNRDFWKEVNKMRRQHNKFPSVVDAQTDNNDISQVFASNYVDLYNSVPCDSSELDEISNRISYQIAHDDHTHDHIVHFSEVCDAIYHLKAYKHEGVCGLSSDFFINAPHELFVHVAMLITAMLVHGHAPSILTTSTIIPIAKGTNLNKSDSAYYRAISLSSIICKIIDLIVINRYSDCLVTSPNQFGFKPKGSTAVCTSLVKETISYYTVKCNDVYGVFLDASKAFDRVHYSKLFCCLFERKLPAVFIRLLFSLYTSHVACVLWNGAYSSKFPIKNGVKQGGILSPVLFCIYIDGLLQRLASSHVGCYIGLNFLGALAYADDIVLLAPTPSAIRMLLKVCDEYAQEYSIIFNGKKSKCMFFPGLGNAGLTGCSLPSLNVGGYDIEYVDSWTHLGHILSSDSCDKKDIEHRRIQTVKQINDVLCCFGKLDAIIKLKLLYSFCSSMYGSELWDMSCSAIASFGVSWRRALKNVWKLPMNTHTSLLYALCGVRPFEVDLKLRACKFAFKCLNSDNLLVRSVIRHVVLLSGCQSPIGKNFISGCQFFGLRVTVPNYCFNFDFHQVLNDASHWTRFIGATVDTLYQLFELIMIRDGVWYLRSNNSDDQPFYFDVKSIIEFICTS